MVVGAVVVVVGAVGLAALGLVPEEPLDPVTGAAPDGVVDAVDGDGLTRGAVAESGRVVAAR